MYPCVLSPCRSTSCTLGSSVFRPVSEFRSATGFIHACLSFFRHPVITSGFPDLPRSVRPLPLFFLSLLLFLCHLLLTPSPLLSSSSLSLSSLLSLSLSLAPPPFTSTYPLVSPHRFFTHSSSSSPHTPPACPYSVPGVYLDLEPRLKGYSGGVLNGFFLFYLVVFAVFAAVFLAGAFFAGVFFAAFSSAFSVVFASAFTVVLVVAFRVVFFLGSSALFALRV